ncbi:MAG: hypothetical protein IPK60_23185 [Sandaracinaceae bacterium]|nr:hypothetical protein [Sandaracinaceae bacterium]
MRTRQVGQKLSRKADVIAREYPQGERLEVGAVRPAVCDGPKYQLRNLFGCPGVVQTTS